MYLHLPQVLTLTSLVRTINNRPAVLPAPGDGGLGVARGCAGQLEVLLLPEDDRPHPAHAAVADPGREQQPLLLRAAALGQPGTDPRAPRLPVSPVLSLPAPGPGQTSLSLRSNRSSLTFNPLLPVPAVSPGQSRGPGCPGHSVQTRQTVQPAAPVNTVQPGLAWQSVSPVQP